jgi:hypothetical protein
MAAHKLGLGNQSTGRFEEQTKLEWRESDSWRNRDEVDVAGRKFVVSVSYAPLRGYVIRPSCQRPGTGSAANVFHADNTALSQ